MNFEELINNLNFSNIFWQLGAVLFFIFGDIISGFLQAIINNDISSKIMKKGLYHKALELLVISGSFVFAYTFNIDIVSKAICIYIIFMEIISILENCQKAGLHLDWVTRYFKKGE